jgi:hypothetical protein
MPCRSLRRVTLRLVMLVVFLVIVVSSTIPGPDESLRRHLLEVVAFED